MYKGQNQDIRDDVCKSIENTAYQTGAVSDQELAAYMRRIFISEGTYVLDTGSSSNVNAEVILHVSEKIENNKRSWKKFQL